MPRQPCRPHATLPIIMCTPAVPLALPAVPALESMERLMVHWHQTTAKHPRPSAGAATSPPYGWHHSDSSSTSSRQDRTSDQEDQVEQLLPFQQQQQQEEAGRAGGSSSGGGNSQTPCEHVACSRLTFCLVEEMKRLKRNYHGRADQVGCSCSHV